MKALILAGGFGTRLKDVIKDVPKPMALIAGKPFLEHQIRSLKKQGVTEIILAVHHGANIIKSYFGNGLRWGVNISYSEEETPLDTAGAIKNAEKYIDDTFLVLNGDSYSKMDLKEFIQFHRDNRSYFTMSLVNPPENGSHYGNVVLKENKIVSFSEKEGEETSLVNGGIYLFEPEIFKEIERDKRVSLEKEIFPKLSQRGKLWGFTHSEYFVDIGRPETYSQFKKEFLKSITLNPENTVRDAIRNIEENESNLIIVADVMNKFKGILTEKIIKRYLSQETSNLNDPIWKISVDPFEILKEGVDDQLVIEKLSQGVNQLPIVNSQKEIVDIKFRGDEIKKEIFPVARGKSPLRISFSGGGTDLPYFFEKHGGVVINSTIDKYCHAIATKRADLKIVIKSDLSDKEEILDSKNIKYDGRFDIIKAVYNLMDPGFGIDLYLYNDLPPGRGLGSSASLSVLIAKLIGQLQGIKYDGDHLAKIAFQAEQKELGIKGGWQDQYAAAIGGFNFMEFNKDQTIIYPLKLKEDLINELNSRLLLCYVGNSHFSGNQHQTQETSFSRDEEEITEKLLFLKENAKMVKDSLLKEDLDNIGKLLHESWEIKKKLSGVSNDRINYLYEIGMKNGCYGGKLLGSGGGGYLLFFHPPKKRNQLVNALEKEGGTILNFNFESGGAKVWFSDA